MRTKTQHRRRLNMYQAAKKWPFLSEDTVKTRPLWRGGCQRFSLNKNSPRKCINANKKHKQDEITQNFIVFSGNLDFSSGKKKALADKIAETLINTHFVKGNRTITPEPDREYKDQVKKINPIDIVTKTGMRLPASNSFTIRFPAPRNTNARLPTIRHKKCRQAINESRNEASNKNF